MRLIDRYISSAVFGAIAVTLVIIIGLDLLANLIDELGDLEGDYGIVEAISYVALRIPSIIYEFIPIACLVGCLFGLGSLASNSELVVIRAAGVSVFQVVMSAMKPALWMMLASLLIGQYIAPKTEQIAESRKSLAQYGERGFVTRGGIWNREGSSFMHFSVVQANGVLFGVSIYEFNDDGKLQLARYSERASFQGDHWILENVAETLLSDSISQRREYPTLRWDTGITPELLSVVIVDPEDLPVTGLWQYSSFLKAQGQNNGEYLLAFWRKVLQPVSTVGLVLLAISFIFGPLRSVTMGYRIFVGVLFGIVFQTVQNMLGPATLVLNIPPIVAPLAPAIICIGIGVVLLRRVQ